MRTNSSRGAAALTLVTLITLLALAACSSAGSQGERCTSGASVACVGPGGCAGGQTCNSDGASFGSCVCGDSGEGGDQASPSGDGGGGSSSSSSSGDSSSSSSSGSGGSSGSGSGSGGGSSSGSSGGSGSSSGSSSGSPPAICAPCWQHWACLAGYPNTSSTLVYFVGTQNKDGSCTLTQTLGDGGVLTAVTLECGGKTDQASSWTYSNVPQLGLEVQFVEAGSVYGSDGSIVSDQALVCGQT